MFEVPVPSRPADRLRTMAGEGAGERYDSLVWEAREVLQGRRVWHVNATAEGGGVAELLVGTLGYLLADGIEGHRLVVEGDARFFEITKRIHNRLHGDLGDGGSLGEAERRHYDDTLARELADMLQLVGTDDIVVVHDPQPAGLVPGLTAAGATVVWTCHVGADTPNAITRSAWDFLRDDVQWARAATFTRQVFAWDGLDPGTIRVIPPCIDPLSLKNVELESPHIDKILQAAGILGASPAHPVAFTRMDGSEAMIAATTRVLGAATVPERVPLVVQVSRWDALKDPVGVMLGFAAHSELDDAHLVLAGPAPSSVADDPEAELVSTA